MGFFNLLDSGGTGGGSTTLISTPIYIELDSGMKNVALTTGGFKENKLLYSSTFDNAAWIKDSAGMAVTANTVANPLTAAVDADKIYETATGGIAHVIYQQAIAGFTSGVSYRLTFYAKYAGRKYFALFMTGTAFSPGKYAEIDIQAGTIRSSSGVTATISAAGNGWHCISLEAAAVATNTGTVSINFRNDADASTYTGDGSSGIYAYGAQIALASSVPAIVTTTSAAVTTFLDNFTIQVTDA